MTNPIPFGRPFIDEREAEAVLKVLKSGTLVHGPQTAAFEKEFAARSDAQEAVALSSCTAGLHLSLFALGIGPGDSVAVPAMTHVATAHAVELVGARPYFVDVDPLTGNIDIELLHSANFPNLRAIMPVHYLGLPCDMTAICSYADSMKAVVIEDCALAVGSTYDERPVGTFGLCGSFSFYPTKQITSIEGGMVVTNDAAFAATLRKVRAFGYSKSLEERSRPGQYDVNRLGFNYRMSEVEAAVGLVQLEKLDLILALRRRNYELLAAEIEQVDGIKSFPTEHGAGKTSHYCFNLVLAAEHVHLRDAIQDNLGAAGIGTSIHYPSAVPQFTYYREKYGYTKGQFPVAEWLASGTISLPVGPHVQEEQAIAMARTVRQTLERLLA